MLLHSGQVTPLGQSRDSRYTRAEASSGYISKSLKVLIVERLIILIPPTRLPHLWLLRFPSYKCNTANTYCTNSIQRRLRIHTSPTSFGLKVLIVERLIGSPVQQLHFFALCPVRGKVHRFCVR